LLFDLGDLFTPSFAPFYKWNFKSQEAHSMKNAVLATAAALTLSATGAMAEAEKYVLDSSHSQVVFTYNHLGFSTTYGMFSGFEGENVDVDRLGKTVRAFHVG
jgi:hypothetical protein